MDQCATLSRCELDLVIMAQIMANIRKDDVGPRSDHGPNPRQRATVTFYHEGFRCCIKTFLMLHGIGKYY